MANIEHGTLGYAEAHVPHFAEYANKTAREAVSGLVTGDDYKESESTMALGALLAMTNAQNKRRLMAESNDVSMQSTLEEWLAVVADLGFDVLLDEPIEGTEDRLRVFWRDGVLLKMDSYWGNTSVNSANFVCNWKGERNDLFSCSNGYAGEIDGLSVWDVNVDAREALRFHIEQLEQRGVILPKWIKSPFLWLLSYQDSKQPNYDYKKINAERISQFPDFVRNAMNSAPTDQ